MAAAIALALCGCVDPPPRNQDRDAEMRELAERLESRPRNPLVEDEIPEVSDADLRRDVIGLSAPEALARLQAANRLRRAGGRGVTAAAALIHEKAKAEELSRAMDFIADSDLEQLESAEQSEIRTCVAIALENENPAVRIAAGRVFKVHGPGDERTAFLARIEDETWRVRWAVVSRFGDHPEELQKPQMKFLLGFLQANPIEDFDRADTDGDRTLSQDEFPLGAEEFTRLERDKDGKVSWEEWTEPVPTAVRVDVLALLHRLHEKLSRDGRPVNYNPYELAGRQLEQVRKWREWIDSLPVE